jgi:hypothetical protein
MDPAPLGRLEEGCRMSPLELVASPSEVAAEVVDLCPICGASGGELCVEEDGQFVLDHFGRPSELGADLRQVSVSSGSAAA